MDYQLLVNNLIDSTVPHLQDEATRQLFLKQIKQIEKLFIKSSFKLNRTIQDKHITTNVLEATISALKIQTENLKEQKLLTEQQAAFKEQLFANVSHELRTPLHGILGMSHLLERSTLNKEQKGYVEIVRSSADNLLVIINDLLNLSKINAGKTSLINEAFSIKKLLKDLEGILAFKAQGKRINLNFHQPTNLPDFVIGDRTRLYQILLNLLNNAVKFTQKGFVALNISFSQPTPESINLQFEVTDSGIGIEQERLNTIFDSFTKLEVLSGDIHDGVGLGLNIVKKLLQMMNGTIEVNSSKGKGTTFTVRLSLDLPPPELIEVAKIEKENINIPDYWKDKKILLIEDNEVNIIYAQNLFSIGAIPLDIAENLRIAYEKLTNTKYDLVLLDVKLPDGNGLSFIEELRSNKQGLNHSVPIIVLTASANDKEAHYAKKLGIESYLSKPFPPQSLIKEIKLIFKNSYPTSFTVKSNLPKANDAYFAHLEKNFKGKPRLQIEMFEIFLNQLPNAILQMEKGINTNDLAIFHYDAHRIKSTIKIIGLPKLTPLITKMDEYAYRKINLEELPDLLVEFKKQAAEDVQIIQNHIEQLKVAN